MLVTNSIDGSLELFNEHQTVEAAVNDFRSHIVHKIDTEEEIALAEDLALKPSEIVEALTVFSQGVQERDAIIAECKSAFDSYDQAFENFEAALKDKDEKIAALVNELRNQQQNDGFAVAAAIREANEQANRDFLLRQRAQNIQHQAQMVSTALVNMNTQRNVAMQNITTMFGNSMANIGSFS
jgi:hypothetical protein